MAGQQRARVVNKETPNADDGLAAHQAQQAHHRAQRASFWSTLAALAALALALAGCGGGGVTAGDGDTIVASSSVKNLCVAPRSGIDPATGQLLTDQPGTVEQEKS